MPHGRACTELDVRAVQPKLQNSPHLRFVVRATEPGVRCTEQVSLTEAAQDPIYKNPLFHGLSKVQSSLTTRRFQNEDSEGMDVGFHIIPPQECSFWSHVSTRAYSVNVIGGHSFLMLFGLGHTEVPQLWHELAVQHHRCWT
ncbi:hypothetical protein Mapa_005480 [Marchantia paleacea]|nr:hypothetical protein Mapa_005480 [Marchantia paleacea]